MDEPFDDDDRLYDLLAAWDEQRRRGHEPSPETLCPDDPACRERLRQMIEAQKRLDACLGLDRTIPDGHAAAEPERPPEIPGLVIEDEIGRGGMGVVYRGRQPSLDRVVAVKLIRGGGAAGQAERSRFRTEALATARIPHPNIVTIHGSGESQGFPYLVLEYLGGGSLAERLRGEPQEPRRTAELVRTLAGAVEAAHERGVVHRDLKPRNIVFAADGTPKITDYGLAKLLDTDLGPTLTGQSPGTPSYMAPEQAGASRGSIGPTTDVHALGAILYEMLTGSPPFRGASVAETLEQVRSQDPVPPSRLRPKLPRDLETICLKCLEKEPARRYASARALGDDLGRFLDGRPIVARRLRWYQRLGRWCSRRPALAAALATSALLAVGLVTSIAWLGAVARVERDQAEAHLDQALEFLNQFYKRFPNEAALKQPEFADLRTRYLTRGVAEFAVFAERFRENPRARRDYINALIMMEQLHHQLKQREKAREFSRLARDAAEAWFRESPREEVRFRTLVGAYHRNLLYEDARAEEIYRRAETAIDGWVRHRPEAEAGLRNPRMLNAFNAAGGLERLGRNEEALALYQKATELADRIARDLGPNASASEFEQLGKVYSRAADVEMDRGHPKAAEALLRRAVALIRRAYEVEPSNVSRLSDYSIACEMFHNFLAGHGKPEETIAVSRRRSDAWERALARPGWRDHERIAIRRGLVRSLFDLEMLHAQAIATLEAAGPGQEQPLKTAWEACEAASRKTHEWAEPLIAVGLGDQETRYADCMSCSNLFSLLTGRAAPADEAMPWLRRAYELVPEDLPQVANERYRSGYRDVLDIYREATGGGNDGTP